MKNNRGLSGFTLIEMLVASVVFMLLLTLLLGSTANLSSLWQNAEGQKSRQQTARAALAILTRDLESALAPTDSADGRARIRVNPALPEFQNPQAAFWSASVSDFPGAGDAAEVGYFVCWTADSQGRPVPELRRLAIPANSTNSIFFDPARALTPDIINRFAGGSSDPDGRGLLAPNVVGFWLRFFDVKGKPLSMAFDSHSMPGRPATAEVALAVVDPRTLARLPDAAAVTNHYHEDVDVFLEALPESLQSGIRIYRTRIPLPAAP